MLLGSILSGLLIDAASQLADTNPFDKIGFDMDVIGRQRRITQLTESTRLAYDQAGMQVNIAVWNMHVPEQHHFDDIIKTALDPMGKGGGFRIVVFRGDGYMRNDGALGLDNWRCSGNVVQVGRVATFKKIKQKSASSEQQKPTSTEQAYLYELPRWMPGWMQWVL